MRHTRSSLLKASRVLDRPRSPSLREIPIPLEGHRPLQVPPLRVHLHPARPTQLPQRPLLLLQLPLMYPLRRRQFHLLLLLLRSYCQAVALPMRLHLLALAQYQFPPPLPPQLRPRQRRHLTELLQVALHRLLLCLPRLQRNRVSLVK
jgi:hypothetical protein